MSAEAGRRLSPIRARVDTRGQTGQVRGRATPKGSASFLDSTKTMETHCVAPDSVAPRPHLGLRFSPSAHFGHHLGGETVSTGSCKWRLRVEDFSALVNTAGNPTSANNNKHFALAA
jgi:hypothetical protein